MKQRVPPRSFGPLLPFALVVTLLSAAALPSAQLNFIEVPDWVGRLVVSPFGDSLTIADQTFFTNPSSTQEELPGVGHKFELLGAMVRDSDPENSVGNPGGSGGGGGGNEVISATVTSGTLALAFRNMPPGIKIAALTNQIGLKYYFVSPKTCGAGSPRVTLLVDADGDRDFDFAAHGHVNPPAHAGCVMNKWRYEDLTDDLGRWEVTPGGVVPGIPVFPFTPWKVFAAAVTAAFPNHRVYAGFLLDGESCSFGVAANCGKAYYDLFTLENRTLEIWHDTVRN